jgi:uncharacterized protein
MRYYEGATMATVTIRIDDNTRDELEEIAHTRGVTLSELIRDQIDGLLGRHVEMQGDAPHTLSPQQRLVLAQQHEILALLHADDEYESRHHDALAELLRQGYAGEYGDVFSALHAEMSRSECKLLWDILDMFRVIEVSIDRLSADDRSALGDDTRRWLRFAGFDMNDSRESRLLRYVHYLVDSERWTEIKPRLAEIGDNGNSHSRRLPSYERMLAVYTPIDEQVAKGARGYSTDAQLLTVDELRQIAAACPWPGRS